MSSSARRRTDRHRWCRVLGILAVALAPGWHHAAAADFEGLPVSAIELRSDAPNLPWERLARLLTLEPGRPFSGQAVARSLRHLQASGLVSEAEAFVRLDNGGVQVTLVLWGRIQVEEVRLEGDLRIKEKELRPILEIHEGDPLIVSRVVRGVLDLEAHYQESGYLDARVRVRPQVDQVAKTAVVLYQIDAGPRFVVAEVAFEGSIGSFQEEQLRSRLRMSVGKPFRKRAARADAERLESWLISQDHRLARVGQFGEVVDWESASVAVSYPVEAGPRFHVEIQGAERSKLEKKGLLPFLDSQRYDEAIVLQSVARVRSYYQGLGHHEVEVDWSETRGDELLHLVMTIDPGPVLELTGIRFEGNEAVSARQLLSLMSTETRRLFRAGSGRLVDETLDDDLNNVLSFLRLEGYWDAEVGPSEVERRDGELMVVVPIHEGLQRRLVDLRIEGTEIIDEADLRRRLSLRPGGPYHPALMDQSVSAIRSYYQSKGFESAQVSSSVEWNDEQTLADVTVRILEGPRSVVDRVVIRGNRRTRSRVIRKAVNLEAGEEFNTGRLLEAQRSLYGLGAFSSVEVRRAPGTPFEGERDILIELDEGNRHNLTYGLGYDTEDGFSGLLGYTRSNLLGRGLTSRLDLRASQRDSLARILLYQPYVGPLRLPTTGSLFYIEETRESFTSRRRGGQIGVERIGDYSRLAVLFDYRLVEVLDPDPALEDIEIDRNLQAVEIGSLTPGWRLDHRNDPLDPTRGWSSNLQLEYAFPVFSAEEEFLKGFAQYTQYLSLGRLGSLGGSLRLGAIEPLRTAIPDPTVPGDQPSQYIPISERFFAGGRSTHRAYRRDLLGIPGESLIPGGDSEGAGEGSSLVPIGGDGLLLFNLDYRFPIAGPVGGNVFLDAGNVWGDWRSIDPTEAKTGLGLGVRYLSPVGPIRVEIGWKLDRLPSEDPYVIFFSVGNPY